MRFWCRVSSSVAGWSRTKLFKIYSFGPLQPVTDSVDHRHHLGKSWTDVSDVDHIDTEVWCWRRSDGKTSRSCAAAAVQCVWTFNYCRTTTWLFSLSDLFHYPDKNLQQRWTENEVKWIESEETESITCCRIIEWPNCVLSCMTEIFACSLWHP